MKYTILFLLISVCSFAQPKKSISQSKPIVGWDADNETFHNPTFSNDSISVVFPKSVEESLANIEKQLQELKIKGDQLTENRKNILEALYGGQGIDPMMLEGAPKYSPGLLKFKRKK